VPIPDVELADTITRYARLARDCPNEVSRPDSISLANAEKDSREFDRPATGCSPGRPCFAPLFFSVRCTIRWTLGCAQNRAFGVHASRSFLVPTALHDAERRCGDLEPVELREQRLQCHHLARRKTRLQLGADGGANSLVASARFHRRT
jgi:hypothetical protein